MINNQLKIYKKKSLLLGEKTHLKKKKKGDLNRVLPGRPSHELTKFCWVFALLGCLPYSDQSNYRVKQVPNRPVRSVKV